MSSEIAADYRLKPAAGRVTKIVLKTITIPNYTHYNFYNDVAPILYHNIGDRVKRNHRRLSGRGYRLSADPKPYQIIEPRTITLQIIEFSTLPL